MEPKILIAFGTRPEIIKLAPVIKALSNSAIGNRMLVVNTSQHDTLIEEQIEFWKIKVDYSLNECSIKNTLSRLLTHTIGGIQDILNKEGLIEYIVVQGDTNTALACSNLAFLTKIKLVHIEAGLRSFNIHNPYPEEFNRIMTSKVAHFHFAPTELAKQNLLNEGIPANKIMVTGNTIMDSFLAVREAANMLTPTSKNKVLITLHRRENIEKNYVELVNIITELSSTHPPLDFLWISHPNCYHKIESILPQTPNLKLIQHLPYKDFIQLYQSTKMVITDSGGVTEEVTHLGLPLIVFRESTERTEPLENGYSMLVSIDKPKIISFFNEHIHGRINNKYSYGDGNSSIKIANWLTENILSRSFDTVIIGGGPAGTGPLLKALKEGNSTSIFGEKFAIIEKSSHLLQGSVIDYQVNSDTLSNVFLECLEGEMQNVVDFNLLDREIKTIQSFDGKSIPLQLLSDYLSQLGKLVKEKLQSDSRCSLLLETTVTKILRLKDGTFRIDIDGNKESVFAKKLIVTTGGSVIPADGIAFAKKMDLSKYKNKTIHSDDLLKGKIDLTQLNSTSKLVILGGSHSAFSAAWQLLRSIPSIGKNSIQIWGRKTPAVFFYSVQEAIDCGYEDFTEDDICKITKRVHRLAGLRMDGRQLYMEMTGLIEDKLEERVSFNMFKDEIQLLEKDLNEADIIITAFGYRFNMPLLFNPYNETIPLIGEKTNHWVNENCELLDHQNKPIPNLFAMGLGTGFIPSGELGGEPSFKGQTNGIWYYQNALAEVILKQLENEDSSSLS